MKKTSIVIGGTKGIGSVISKSLKKRGDLTFIISRNKLDNKNFFKCDINSNLELNILKKKIGNKKIDNLIFSQRYRGANPEKDFAIFKKHPFSKYFVNSAIFKKTAIFTIGLFN